MVDSPRTTKRELRVRRTPIEGGLEIRCEENGRPRPFTALESKAARRFASLQLVAKELAFCRALCVRSAALTQQHRDAGGTTEYDPENQTMVQIRANYTAAVITYGKTFSGTGAGRFQLQWKRVFDGSGARYLAFHRWVMENHRHQFIAHAQSDDLESGTTAVVFRNRVASPQADAMFALISYAAFYAGFSGSNFKSMLKLIDYVLGWVRDEQKALGDHIYRTELTNEHIPHLFAMSKEAMIEALPKRAPEIPD
ncbi:MAG: hypothetical protein EOP38_25290 [Rubrivivax sp.]|nr:MAG: hypothetical protein EOP38_25290 [Rubrivivax sp.]